MDSKQQAEYQAVTAYTIHYSSARMALATFFATAAFYIPYNLIASGRRSFWLSVIGFCVISFGYFVFAMLTNLMVNGLKRLEELETMQDSVVEDTTFSGTISDKNKEGVFSRKLRGTVSSNSSVADNKKMKFFSETIKSGFCWSKISHENFLWLYVVLIIAYIIFACIAYIFS